MKFKRKQINILLFIVVIMGGIAFIRWQNNSITISEIVFKNHSIPESFNRYKILHISDLHNKEFGANENKILGKIEKINPDIIVITGDLIDSKNTNIDIAMDLINGAINIAPIYYVSGNHEGWFGSYDELKSKLENSGVIVLDNEKIELFNEKASIDIIGLSDSSLVESTGVEYGGDVETINLLSTLTEESTNFKILLSHRPELFHIYSKSNVDLVFSGHAHGGQFRIPFIGGLIAPDQGFFPKLTAGMHQSNYTAMVISRGLGNSIIPVRIFNRPEIVVVTLSK